MELNETYTERFLLAVKRLNDIVEENHDTPLGTYFTTVSRFLLDVAGLADGQKFCNNGTICFDSQSTPIQRV